MAKSTYTVPLSVMGQGCLQPVRLPDPFWLRRKYPFKEMAIGDDEFFEGEDSEGRAAHAARTYGYRNGKVFSTRTVEGGVRIWRTG